MSSDGIQLSCVLFLVPFVVATSTGRMSTFGTVAMMIPIIAVCIWWLVLAIGISGSIHLSGGLPNENLVVAMMPLFGAVTGLGFGKWFAARNRKLKG